MTYETNLRKAVAVALIVGLSATSLLACETIERETGLGKETQTGVVGGAAVGGVLAALVQANPAWIAASILLGGAAGGYLAEHLSEKDAKQHAQTQYGALDHLQAGETSSWNNPDTGRSGSTTVNDVFEMADGTVCKNFTETIRTEEKTLTESATACKAPGGTWEVRRA